MLQGRGFKYFKKTYCIVWINDYHLMLVPEMVRKRLSSAPIGFFL